MEPATRKRSWWGGWNSLDEEETPREHIFEARLDRAQRELRIHRALFALLLLAGLGGGGWWWLQPPDPPADVLRAHRIEVLSAEGRTAVVLDADRVGGRIAVRYNRPVSPPPPALFISAEPEGGAIQIFEPGQTYYALSAEVGKGGEGVLALRARGRQEGLELRGPSQPRAGGRLLLFNAAGHPAVRLGTDESGRGVVSANGAGKN